MGISKINKEPEPQAYEAYCIEEDEFFPSVLNECIELNLLLLEKIYNTFQRKPEKVIANFRKDNFHHLKPKIIEIIERPPDEFLRNKKRNDKGNNELDNIIEENSINDETVLINKNSQIDDTYDKDQNSPDMSGTHISDRNFDQEYREQIDRQGLRVGSRGGLTREQEEQRRLGLLNGLNGEEKSDDFGSRKSSTIPEGEEIHFQDPNFAMLNSDGSDNDDADSEARDMVFYLKEDQTQYSKPLGLNKAPRKKNGSKTLSDDDISLEPSLDGSKLLGDQIPKESISEIGEENSLFSEIDGGNGDGEFDPNGGNGALFYPRGTEEDNDLVIDGDNKDKKGRKKKLKQKRNRLTREQMRKLRGLNDVYGQDSEQLGLSPRDERYYNPKNKGKITKKSRKEGNRTSISPGESKHKKGRRTVEELRARRFGNLNLDKEDKGEGEYDKLRKKLHKFRKRKDLSFWIDYDSPYAEYLPHRFREWIPETKSGLNLDENYKNANDKANELSRIYSRGLGIPEEENEGNMSKLEVNQHLSPSQNRNSSKNLRPLSNASAIIENMDALSSNNKRRKLTSSKRNKNTSKREIVQPPVHIDF